MSIDKRPCRSDGTARLFDVSMLGLTATSVEPAACR
jgi:hypothetical protein